MPSEAPPNINLYIGLSSILHLSCSNASEAQLNENLELVCMQVAPGYMYFTQSSGNKNQVPKK